MRGQAANVNDTRVSANGYHYTRTESGWRLTHHLVAEGLLGRKLQPDERVVFRTKNKLDLSEDNIQVVPKGKSSVRRRIAQVEARIAELQAELHDLKHEAQ